MISPIQLGSPEKVLLYHKDGLAPDDGPEMGGAAGVGTWAGIGAEKLGLAGPVTERQLGNLLRGLDPETGEKLTARIKKDRRSGMDFTIAPPKSVSIAAEVLGDERIISIAHQSGVEAAIAVFQRGAAARVRAGGVQRGERTTGNLIVAKFDHETSRPAKEGEIPDCQIHSHLVIPNLTWDEEAGDNGGWRALENSDMLDVQALVDAAYCHVVGQKLREMGYELRKTKEGRSFEIVGISDGIIEKFSKRHTDIQERTEQALAEGIGRDAKKVAAVVAQAARAKKDTVSDKATLQKAWLGQLTDWERQELNDLREAVLLREGKIKGAPALLTPSQYEAEFMRLSAITMAAEKTPDRLMTPEEVVLMNKDWREYSKSRGYSEGEIADFQRWMDLQEGLTVEDFEEWEPDSIHQKIVAAAIRNSKPVSVAAVQAYGLALPVGYEQQGEHFVREMTEKEALDWSIAHCFERASVVKPGTLTEHALRYAAGSSRVTAHGLGLLIEAEERFLWSKGRDRLTTRAVAAAERQIIGIVEEGIGKRESLVKNIPASLLIPVTPEEEDRREAAHNKSTSEAVREAMRCEVIRELAERMGVKLPRVPKSGKDLDAKKLLSYFSEAQREEALVEEGCLSFSETKRIAVLDTLNSKDTVSIFRGGAGTGKSYTLNFIEQQLEREGYRVVVAAPMTGQVYSLTNERGRPAITVASLLARKPTLSENTVLLVDEGGQIGANTMKDLLSYAKQYGARVILSGDVKQHSSVESGDAMRAIQKFTQATRVDLGDKEEDIRRQHQSWYKKVVALAALGKAAESFARLEKLDAAGRALDQQFPNGKHNDGRLADKARIFDFTNDEERLRAVAAKAVELFEQREKIMDPKEKEKHSFLVLSQTKKEVGRLNDCIRQGLVDKGILSGEERVIKTLDPSNFTSAEKLLLSSYHSQENGRIVLIANREIKTASDQRQVVIAKGALLEFGGLVKGWPTVIMKDGTRCILSKADMKHLNAGKLNEMPVRVGDVLRLRESLQVGMNVAGSKMRTPDGSNWGKKFTLPDGSEPKYQYRGRRIPNGSIVKVAGWTKEGKMLIDYEVKTSKKNEHGEMVTEVSKMQATVGRPLLANRAYAITSYGAQGQTVGFTLYSDSGSKGATSARQWYVDISRATSGIWLFTSDREGLRERIRRPGERELATEMLGGVGNLDISGPQAAAISLADTSLAAGAETPAATKPVPETDGGNDLARDPWALTPEAEDLLAGIDKGGAAPTALTTNLKRIAAENSIELTDQTKPDDLVAALRQKKSADELTDEDLYVSDQDRDLVEGPSEWSDEVIEGEVSNEIEPDWSDIHAVSRDGNGNGDSSEGEVSDEENGSHGPVPTLPTYPTPGHGPSI